MKRFMVRAVLIIIVIAAFIVLWEMYRSSRRECTRLKDNQRTLFTDVEIYRTRDSLSAAGVERLTLTNREFKRYASRLEKTVKTLDLKVRRLQSVAQVAVSTRYPVTARLWDSLVSPDIPEPPEPSETSEPSEPPETVRRLYYRDRWLTIDGTVRGSEFLGTIESRDTLVQVIHRVPRRFWFVRWGTKAVRQEVTTRNPYSRITYTEYIELKRRRR